MENIRKLVKPPVFASKDFLVTSYGAVGDAKTLNTEAFKQAIDDCNRKGGGRVVVPYGVFQTGASHLKAMLTCILQTVRGCCSV